MTTKTVKPALKQTNKTKKSLLRKLIGTLHLWVGLTSGTIVFIVAITGCLYAFQSEIQDLTQSYRFVEPQQKAYLQPTALREIADKQLPGKHIHSINYLEKDRAAQAVYYADEAYFYYVYLNPYTGAVLKVKDENADFFRWVLDGHFYLWLPHEIGQPLIASATLVFLFMIISGIYLWWPRNKNGAKQRFSIKWNARWRRKNYDLHNVIGFYVSWLALIFAITGLMWGFQWFAGGYYAVISGGEQLQPYQEPLSVKTVVLPSENLSATDKVWLKVAAEHPAAKSIEMHFPETDTSSILAAINPENSTYWKLDYRFFDQYTLKELPVTHMWGRFQEATKAQKLMRMNYDIHVGAILGFPGKMLAFFASLLIASLPITGFMIWKGRRDKKKSGLRVAEL